MLGSQIMILFMTCSLCSFTLQNWMLNELISFDTNQKIEKHFENQALHD